MAEGYIKLFRKITQNPLWMEKPFSRGQAWVDLLFMANHRDNKFLLGNVMVSVKRGQLIVSEPKLSDRWGWSRTKVRAFLALLESEAMIVKKSDNKKTTLTICNYSVFNDFATAEEQQKDSKKTSKRQQKNTNKNVKNDKNEKECLNTLPAASRGSEVDEFFESVWKLYPKKEGKANVSPKQKSKLFLEVGFEQMARAIDRYKQKIKAEGIERRFIKHGSTFFNSGYVDYLDTNYEKPDYRGPEQTEYSLDLDEVEDWIRKGQFN